jgi:hypothetical protein
MRFILLFCLLLPYLGFAQNELPQISNLIATLDTENNLLTISYDVDDAEGDSLEISLEVSDGQNPVYLLNTENATGDIGYPILSGTGKTINWSYTGLIENGGEHTIRLVANDRYEIDIQEIVDQVDSNRLRSDLEFICGVRHRITGAAHLEEVKDSIEQLFLAQGLIASRQAFNLGSYEAHNIIGLKTGTTESENVYIIDAHFDTVDDAPGADDNGSGVAGFMEALRVLSPYNFKKSIKFIGFDLEEEGLIGSNRYVNSGGIPDYENTEGVLNFEMIGYYDDAPNTQILPSGFEILFPAAAAELEADDYRGNFLSNVAKTASLPLHDAFAEAADTYVPDLKIISLVAPDAFVPPDLLRSDHAYFWGADIQALMLTDGANFRNMNYHTPDDEFNTLNFNFMTNVVKAAVATLAELADVEHSTTSETAVNLPTKTFEALDCEVAIYQNAEQNITLQFNHCNQQPDLIEIYAINGQRIFQQRMGQFSQNYLEINSKQLPSGLYLVKLSQRNHLHTEKVFIR